MFEGSVSEHSVHFVPKLSNPIRNTKYIKDNPGVGTHQSAWWGLSRAHHYYKVLEDNYAISQNMKHNLNTILLKYTTHELPYGRTTFQDYYCDHNLLVHTALSNNIKTKKIKRHKVNRPKLYWLQLLKRKMKTKQTTKGNCDP